MQQQEAFRIAELNLRGHHNTIALGGDVLVLICRFGLSQGVSFSLVGYRCGNGVCRNGVRVLGDKLVKDVVLKMTHSASAQIAVNHWGAHKEEGDNGSSYCNGITNP